MIRNLEPMLEGLVAAGWAARFHLYILSDTSDAEVAATEETRFAAFASRLCATGSRSPIAAAR